MSFLICVASGSTSMQESFASSDVVLQNSKNTWKTFILFTVIKQLTLGRDNFDEQNKSRLRFI